jgi:hypothetical protein
VRDINVKDGKLYLCIRYLYVNLDEMGEAVDRHSLISEK